MVGLLLAGHINRFQYPDLHEKTQVIRDNPVRDNLVCFYLVDGDTTQLDVVLSCLLTHEGCDVLAVSGPADGDLVRIT